MQGYLPELWRIYAGWALHLSFPFRPCTHSIYSNMLWLNWGSPPPPPVCLSDKIQYSTCLEMNERMYLACSVSWLADPLVCLFHQVYGSEPAVLLSSPTPCGIIPPHSTAHIPLVLETQVIGAHRSTVYISVFGSPNPPMVRASFLDCKFKLLD